MRLELGFCVAELPGTRSWILVLYTTRSKLLAITHHSSLIFSSIEVNIDDPVNVWLELVNCWL